MDKMDFENQYWKHYLILENDFIKTVEYISLDIQNSTAYSTQYLKIFLSIGSEIDIICKAYCAFLDNSQIPSKINEYSNIICSNRPDFVNKTITIKTEFADTSINLKPWNKWDTVTPIWWKFYNKVKHQRTEGLTLDTSGIRIDSGHPDYPRYNTLIGMKYYKFANQENLLTSLAALFQLCMECYYDIIQESGNSGYDIVPKYESNLFTLVGRERRFRHIVGFLG